MNEAIGGINVKDCLSCDPFEGDFGDPGDRVLKDKIVKSRVLYPCDLCGQTIWVGEYARSRTDISGGKLMSFKWCSLCSKAMAKSHYDDGESLNIRIAHKQTPEAE